MPAAEPLRDRQQNDADIADIYDRLYRLGLAAVYTGFFHTSFAVYLAVIRPEVLLSVTKELYPEVAKHYGTSASCVERNIRTAVGIAWDRNRLLLEKYAGCRLTRKPKPSEFIAILSGSISRGIKD